MIEFSSLRRTRRLEESGLVVIATAGGLLSFFGGNKAGAALWGLGVGGYLAWVAWKASRAENASAWPLLEGFIESSRVAIRNRGEGPDEVGVELAYSYRTKGDYYSRELFQRCGSEAEADELAAQLRKDSKVLVHCHPERPEKSALDVEVNAAATGLSAGAVLLTALATVVALLVAFVLLLLFFGAHF